MLASRGAAPIGVELADAQFERIRKLIYEIAGISLSDPKRSLVSGRLAKRLRILQLEDYQSYIDFVLSPQGTVELQTMVDLITTNETYFFRESGHFEYLADRLLAGAGAGQPINIWSAACSSGEEVYTLAMVLAEHRGIEQPWRILGSDISTRVLEIARSGHYPISKTRGLPEYYLKRYCLKGVRSQVNTFKVAAELRCRTEFRQVNLIRELPEDLGPFDAIFLRNVMIYFDLETKRQVVAQLATKLRPGGYLFIGHSESLHGMNHPFQFVQPTIYQRPL